MRCVLLPLMDEADWRALSPTEQGREMAAFGAFGAALAEAGALVGNYRPQPSAAAKTVRVTDGQTRVLDGPHADTEEQLGGIYIIDVPDLDAALMWAARAPTARYGVVEVRPLWGGHP
jgi:hypothetical protein